MKRPTPLELMAYADGELDEPQAREVACWLVANPEDRALVAGMRSFHEQVGEAAERLVVAPPVDLTDSIFAAIERENRESAPAKSGPRLTSRRVAEPPAVQAGPQAARVASLHRRRPYGPALAGVFAVAAAGLLWWRSPAPTQLASPAEEPSHAQVTSAIVASVAIDDDAVIGDDGSAITSVEFGAQSGAIFYVRGDNTASAVLWLEDNEVSP